jgi:prevent-host-death family protein
MTVTRTVTGTEMGHGGKLGGIVHRVRNDKETIVVTNHGRPAVVMVSMQEYDALMAVRAELAKEGTNE